MGVTKKDFISIAGIIKRQVELTEKDTDGFDCWSVEYAGGRCVSFS